ncbi:MAG: AbrB/MazE/SpoVT family DNA-binding domain-containing protein [Tepidiformaceae bacterium]
MRVTSKGQVTIPAALREMYSISAETELEFYPDADGIRIVKAQAETRRQIRTELARMTGTADAGMTTAEIMALMRGGED